MSNRKLMRTLYPVDKTTRKKMWKKKQKNKMEIRQKFKGRDIQESKTTLLNINSTLALHKIKQVMEASLYQYVMGRIPPI